MHARWLMAVLALGAATLPRAALAQDMAADTGPAVTEAVLATGVVDREPQGVAETFPATVGNVFCFTRIGSAQAGTAIEHVWYHNDQEVGRKELSIGGSPWRTWSSKVIPDWATGQWRVDIVSNGNVLQSLAFTVQ